MALKPYGKKSRPVFEDFLTKIVDVSWSGEERHDNYLRLFYTVYWKMWTERGLAHKTSPQDGTEYDEAHAIPNEPFVTDRILRTLVSYRNVFWPWDPRFPGMVPAPGPYDVPPNEGHQNVAIFPAVIGAPELPGDSGFLAGTGCDNYGRDLLRPAIRALPSEGFDEGQPFDPRWPDDMPEPPSYVRLGVTYVQGAWNTPLARVELYQWPSWSSQAAGGMPGTFPIVASLPLNYSAVRVKSSNTFYRAVAYAPEPKEEGTVLYDPPFSTDPNNAVAANTAMDRCNYVILCERMLNNEADAEGLEDAFDIAFPPPEEPPEGP